MKSAGDGGILKDRLQVLHVHVLLAAPLGSGYMTKLCADQHQRRVPVRKYSDHPCPAPDLTVLIHRLDIEISFTTHLFGKIQYIGIKYGDNAQTAVHEPPVRHRNPSNGPCKNWACPKTSCSRSQPAVPASVPA